MNRLKVLLIIILVCIGVGVYFFIPVRVPSLPQESSESVAQSFYDSYMVCLQKPPIAAAGQVAAYCQRNNIYGSSDLAAHILAGGVAQAGVDPIFCAQNPPESVSMTNATLEPDATSKVLVIESYGEDQQKEIHAVLVQQNNIWKVDNVLCQN